MNSDATEAGSADIIIATDSNLRITSVRRRRPIRAGSESRGNADSDIVGDCLIDHIVDMCPEEARGVCEKILAGETFGGGERSFRRVLVKPGFPSQRWTLVLGPNLGQGGRVEGVVFARYCSSEPLSDFGDGALPDHIYQRLIENAADFILLMDRNAVITFANRRVRTWDGVPVDDVVGRRLEELVHPDDVLRCEQALEGLLTTGEPQLDVDFRVVLSDGSTAHLVANASLVSWGDEPQVLAVCRNVTDSVQLNEKLVARNRALSALNEIVMALSGSDSLHDALHGALRKILAAVDSSRGWVLLTDSSGKLAVAAQAEIDSGEDGVRGHDLPACDAICAELEQTVVSSDINDDIESTPQIREISTEAGTAAVLAIPLKCGSQHKAVLAISLRSSGGLSVEQTEFVNLAAGMLGPVIENASLRATEREKSRQLAAFAKEVQHRVKNNLQMIAGLLSMSDKDGLSGERAVERSLRLVGAIAAVQEMISEESLVQGMSLKMCLEQVARSVLMSAGGGDTVQLCVDGGGLLVAPESATAVAVIVGELVSNSVEHAFGSSASRRISVAASKDGDQTVIEVVDNGKGLPPGFNMDASGASGSGLGLVRALTHYGLGGRFEIVDTGSGTCARLRF